MPLLRIGRDDNRVVRLQVVRDASIASAATPQDPADASYQMLAARTCRYNERLRLMVISTAEGLTTNLVLEW